jgi:hypothetical protein
MHVDAAKARVFLSMRRTKPNPLLETLDSLVSSSVAAAAAEAGAAAEEPVGSAEQAPPSTAAQPNGGSPDMRLLLGDLPEAARFCEVLLASPGVLSAQLGMRLQSRAASQELEVYLATQTAAQDGKYNLALRKERSVQEVAVVATLPREEMRQLAAASVAAVAAQAVPSKL